MAYTPGVHTGIAFALVRAFSAWKFVCVRSIQLRTLNNTVESTDAVQVHCGIPLLKRRPAPLTGATTREQILPIVVAMTLLQDLSIHSAM
jgi:hypothetical protein